MEGAKLIITIISVKEKYLKCKDIQLKKLVGKVLAGDIKQLSNIKYLGGKNNE